MSETEFTPEYRIVESDAGFEPQMSFLVRGVVRWLPLNREGYWADPDGWNDDEVTVRLIMKDREMAERAIILARPSTAQTSALSIQMRGGK